MIRVPDMDSDGTGTTKLAGAPLRPDSNVGHYGQVIKGLQTRAIDTNKISPDDRSKIHGDIRANQGKAPVPKKPERPW